MYLDASAIVAILGEEEEAAALVARLEGASSPVLVSSLAIFEAATGLARKKAAPGDAKNRAALIEVMQAAVEGFLEEVGAIEIEITAEIGRDALEACKRYGLAVGSPAGLNFGDCYAYACARTHGVPLLYKGNDFARTDLA